MNVNLELNKAKSKRVNKSMSRINVRNMFISSRTNGYYIGEDAEQFHKNEVNKLIIKKQ